MGQRFFQRSVHSPEPFPGFCEKRLRGMNRCSFLLKKFAWGVPAPGVSGHLVRGWASAESLGFSLSPRTEKEA